MGRWTDWRAKSHALIHRDYHKLGEEDWMTCVHCCYGWKVEPGSGRMRGWCNECKGPVCHRGPQHCKPCPFLAKLRFYVAVRGGDVEWNKAVLMEH